MEQVPAAQEARDCLENKGQKRKRESKLPDGDTLVESPVAFWAREGFWPPKYKRQGRQHILAQKCPTESVLSDRMERIGHAEDSREAADPNEAEDFGSAEDGESDCWAHEQKFDMYANLEYKLDKERSFIDDSLDGADPEITHLCQKWLQEPQELPDGLESGVDFFEFIEQDDKTELDSARLFSSHMMPYEGVQILRASFYRGWNSSVPLAEMRPQPDLTVGFALCELTEDQLQRLHPFIGDDPANHRSFFMATDKICFPFLTYELMDNSLDEADLMNAHSMTLAVRGVVELFRLVNRQRELHAQILGFSLSHDCTSVRIYGHYAEIDGKRTTYYRHEIHSYRFEHEDEEGKWAAHRFVKNVYEKWMPEHYERICSAINQLPLLGSNPEAMVKQKWDPISQLPDAFAHLETE